MQGSQLINQPFCKPNQQKEQKKWKWQTFVVMEMVCLFVSDHIWVIFTSLFLANHSRDLNSSVILRLDQKEDDTWLIRDWSSRHRAVCVLPCDRDLISVNESLFHLLFWCCLWIFHRSFTLSCSFISLSGFSFVLCVFFNPSYSIELIIGFYQEEFTVLLLVCSCSRAMAGASFPMEAQHAGQTQHWNPGPPLLWGHHAKRRAKVSPVTSDWLTQKRK